MVSPVTSHDAFDRVRTALENLGYRMRERWTGGTSCDAVVVQDGTEVCRIAFTSSNAGMWDLRVHPTDPDSTQTIVRAGEARGQPEACFTLEEIDRVESLFRMLSVRAGSLHQVDFASDYALQQWVAKASTMLLPHERSPRRPFNQDVVIRPGESPARLFPCTTRISQSMVQATRLLDRDFQRERAVEVAVAAARQEPDSQDAGLGWLAHSARTLLRGRRRDMDMAWDGASHDKVPLRRADEADGIGEAYEHEPSEESAPAPGL